MSKESVDPTGDLESSTHQASSNYFSVDDLDRLCSERSFDFIVVGAGGAGAAAAIEAKDRGASVLILEKMDTPGGSTEISGGSIRLVNDAVLAKEHLAYLAMGATPQDVIDTFVDGLLEVPEWLIRHGGEFESWNNEGAIGAYFPVGGPAQYRHLPLSSSVDSRIHIKPRNPERVGGAALWDLLSDNLAKLSIPIVVGARVRHLVQSFPDRSIIGVEVERGQESVTVTARLGVVLCCGGFSKDSEMMRQYLGIELPSPSPTGRAQGDGIRMAQEVGADLWHMTAPAANIGFSAPDIEHVVAIGMSDFGFVLVDQLGRRFDCETDLEAHSAARAMMTLDVLTAEHLRTPSFLIFDETTRLAGRLGTRGLSWSADNTAEIDRGWIKKAGTVAELGTLLGFPAEQLGSTVDAFNLCATSGTTDQFGRPAEKMRELSRPPYYAIAISPTLVNTQGGPRRNALGEIIRPDGSPIAGLYGAGEMGSVWTRMYPSGGNVAETIVSGRRAITSALARLAAGAGT